jgi:iron complex outermembrane receptor protein
LVPGIVLFGRLGSLRIERGQPIDRVNMALDFERDWLGPTVGTNRFGEVLSPGADAFNDLLLEAKWITDMEVRVRPFQTIELAVGADNMLNVCPTRGADRSGPRPGDGGGPEPFGQQRFPAVLERLALRVRRPVRLCAREPELPRGRPPVRRGASGR